MAPAVLEVPKVREALADLVVNAVVTVAEAAGPVEAAALVAAVSEVPDSK